MAASSASIYRLLLPLWSAYLDASLQPSDLRLEACRPPLLRAQGLLQAADARRQTPHTPRLALPHLATGMSM